MVGFWDRVTGSGFSTPFASLNILRWLILGSQRRAEANGAYHTSTGYRDSMRKQGLETPSLRPEAEFIQCRMSYFLDLERLAAFLPVFLGGRPSFGLGTNVLTSDSNTKVLPASVTFDKRPRLMRSAIACFDTPRVRAASAWEM